MHVFLIALLTLAVATTNAKPRVNCSCNEAKGVLKGTVMLQGKWKDVDIDRTYDYHLELYHIPDNQLPCPSPNPYACYDRYYYGNVTKSSGTIREQALRAGPTSATKLYCVLSYYDNGYYLGTLDKSLTNCELPGRSPFDPPRAYPSPPTSTENDVPTLRIVFFAFTGVVAFLLIAGSIVRIFRHLKNKLNPRANTLDSIDGGGAVELDQMGGPGYTTVQMFPSHPMMQTQQTQVYQDPLATLAPVYTATYVQPGVQ